MNGNKENVPQVARPETIYLAIEAVKRNNREIKNRNLGPSSFSFQKKELINQNLNILAKLESLL